MCDREGSGHDTHSLRRDDSYTLFASQADYVSVHGSFLFALGFRAAVNR